MCRDRSMRFEKATRHVRHHAPWERIGRMHLHVVGGTLRAVRSSEAFNDAIERHKLHALPAHRGGPQNAGLFCRSATKPTNKFEMHGNRASG